MNEITEFLDGVVKAALVELRADPIPIYTFAFYYDHESAAVSVCADTKESSLASIRQSNKWSMDYFAQHIREGNWDDASLFQANVGRSLSLGDFTRVNVARTDLPTGFLIDESFYLSMARVVIANQHEILEFALDPEEIVFCCSSADSEVGLTWTVIKDAEQKFGADAQGRTEPQYCQNY